MLIRTVLATIFVFTAAIVSVQAQDGLAMMKIEAGAEPAGMGGAFVSVSNDPDAGAYNPAAARGDRFTVSFGHNTYWTNVRLETAYFMTNLTGRSWLHGGIRYASVDDIEHRARATADPDYLFDAQDVSFKTGLTVGVTEKLYAGIAFGWFVEKIDTYRGSKANLDFGLQYELKPQLHLGASITNVGGDMRLSLPGQPSTDVIPLPTTWRMGASYYRGDYTGVADIVSLDSQTHLHLGAQRWIKDALAVRAGFMTGYDSKNFTAGLSFARRGIVIDYAFVPYSNDLGTAHLFNLTGSL